MREWHKTFFSGLYDEVLANQFQAQRTQQQAKMIRKLLRLRKGTQILDVPCGMGRLSLPLADRGMNVTGVDFSAKYIARARRVLRKARLDARFFRRDMREIEFDREFDVVLNWFTSFGYFDRTGDLNFLERAWKALKPGGRILIEMSNKSWDLAHKRPRAKQVVAGVTVSHLFTYDPSSGRMNGVWRLSKGKRREQHRLSLKLYNGADMRRILREAGFRNIRLYGHPPLGRFSRHSRRMIAVAERLKE
jgi:2-polyprenyl-3-methyl-5-hydroxy-6-metoxy-1,4-benzoquinol methylase